MKLLLEARQLEVRIGERMLCHQLDWRIADGEFWAVLGKNGAGKSTLLTTLAGLRPPQSGEIKITGRPARQTSLRKLAQLRAYLPQIQFDAFASTVLETVLHGRHPHLARWRWETVEDQRIAAAALAEVGLSGLSARNIQTLSGGERQRVALAALLAQRPLLYLLDEPLAHLDFPQQMSQLRLLAGKAATGAGIAAVLHDPGLARRHCSHALLLFGDGRWLAGTAAEAINATNLSRLYDQPMKQIRVGDHAVFVLD